MTNPPQPQEPEIKKSQEIQEKAQENEPGVTVTGLDKNDEYYRKESDRALVSAGKILDDYSRIK